MASGRSGRRERATARIRRGVLTLAAMGLAAAWLLGSLSPEGGRGTAEDPLRENPRERRGIYVTSTLAGLPERLAPLVEGALMHELNALVIDIKDNHGVVAYDTGVQLAREIGAREPRLDPEALVRTLKARGFYVIARQVVFYDPKLAAHLGSPIAPWVDPEDPRAVAYNLAIAQEAAALGFDELQFDYLRYPDGGSFEPIYEDRYRAITGFLRQVHQAVHGRINLSVDVFGRTLRAWNAKRVDPIGQSLEALMPYAEVLSPMVYPSHYESPYYWHDPYGTIKRDLTTGLRRGLVLRPYLQAFERRLPEGMGLVPYIREQVRAVRELGIYEYLFWNPDGDYEALWRALERAPSGGDD